MYTTLQKLAVSIYSFITPLHHTIERLTVVKSKSGWRRHFGYFTSNTRRLFPPELIHVERTQPIQKDWIFIDIKEPWTIRRCQEVAEEIGHPHHIVQDYYNRKRVFGIRVPTFILDLVNIQARSISFLAEIAIIHRADSIRLARIRTQIQQMYPELPASQAEYIVRRMPGVQRRKGSLFHCRNIDLEDVVHMAVAAYARHKYTRYESLINSGVNIYQARNRTRDAINSKLRMWRGSTEEKMSKPKAKRGKVRHLIEKVVQAEDVTPIAAGGRADRPKTTTLKTMVRKVPTNTRKRFKRNLP